MSGVRRGLVRYLVPCVVIGLLAVGSAEAATINVSPGQSIQDAIDGAASGDEVVVAVGTYTELIDFKGKAITVRSTDPSDPAVVAATIIDGDAAGSVVTFKLAEGSDSVLRGFTITNGSGTDIGVGYRAGGGIFCSGSSPTIFGNTISGNSAAYGGGISCLDSAAPTISGNTISGNTASFGGGIYCYYSSPTISGNTIRMNWADWGGGILCVTNGSLTISGNTISRNSALHGGGIVCADSSPAISRSTLSYNQASHGGGILLTSGTVTIVDSIIAFSDSGPGIEVYTGTAAAVRHSDVYGNAGGNYVNMPDPTGTNGNLSVDPLFANAAGGDCHLRSRGGRWDPLIAAWVVDPIDSPCIDAGDPASGYGNEPTPNGGRVNMGAYGNTTEASKTANRAPTAPAVVAVSPGSPGTADDLTASASGATDADGDSVTYDYEWSKSTDGGGTWTDWSNTAGPAASGGEAAADSGNVLDHRLTAKGEEWKARARASDGLLVSDWTESDPVAIQDTPPTPPTVVTIDPGSPHTDDDLTASASGSTDLDGDPITYEYEWCCSTDGSPWTAWGWPGATLPCGETAKGHQWKARACATVDGETSGWTESDPVTISNSAPTLAWTGEPRFRRRGHSPDRGRPNRTAFAFRVTLTDADGTRPRRLFARLQRIEDGRQWRTVTTVSLDPVSGDWAGGMICQARTTLPNGAYRCMFYARDDEGAIAAGEPTQWRPGPKIVAAPQLWCTALPGRQDDFLDPQTGTAGQTKFRFAVQYTDGEGTLPHVRSLELQKKRADGRWGHFATLTMKGWSANPLTGKHYVFSRRLPAGEYRHRFVFEDDNGLATGMDSAGPNATLWQDGPVVSEATADAIAGSGGAMVTSLAALASPGGAEIVFCLSAPMSVDARILNIAGRPVKTLFRAKDCEAGANRLLWNAKSDSGLPVPNGTYLIEMMARAGDGAQARAMAQVRIGR